jgi:hypothetical protein
MTLSNAKTAQTISIFKRLTTFVKIVHRTAKAAIFNLNLVVFSALDVSLGTYLTIKSKLADLLALLVSTMITTKFNALVVVLVSI